MRGRSFASTVALACAFSASCGRDGEPEPSLRIVGRTCSNESFGDPLDRAVIDALDPNRQSIELVLENDSHRTLFLDSFDYEIECDSNGFSEDRLPTAEAVPELCAQRTSEIDGAPILGGARSILEFRPLSQELLDRVADLIREVTKRSRFELTLLVRLRGRLLAVTAAGTTVSTPETTLILAICLTCPPTDCAD